MTTPAESGAASSSSTAATSCSRPTNGHGADGAITATLSPVMRAGAGRSFGGRTAVDAVEFLGDLGARAQALDPTRDRGRPCFALDAALRGDVDGPRRVELVPGELSAHVHERREADPRDRFELVLLTIHECDRGCCEPAPHEQWLTRPRTRPRNRRLSNCVHRGGQVLLM